MLQGNCEVAFSQVLGEAWQETPLLLPLPQLPDVLTSSRQKPRVRNRYTDVHLLLSSRLSFFYILIVHAFISQVPQIGLLKTTEMYCLIVLEAQSQNQGVSRATLPLKPLWETPSLPLLASGIGQPSLAFFGLQIYHASLCFHCHMVSSLCLCVFVSLHDILLCLCLRMAVFF